MAQYGRLDRVNQPSRRSLSGNQVVPAARREVAALPTQPGNVGGYRIETVKIVQQPAVQALLPKSCGDGAHVESRGAAGCGLTTQHPFQYSLQRYNDRTGKCVRQDLPRNGV